MKFRLDPFPKFSETALAGLLNARILIFSVVVAKITLDRLYKYAMIVNPLGYDADGEPTLDILEYQNPWTSDQVHMSLNSYGAKGRQAYLSYLFYDCVFVLARTVPMLVICTWPYKKAPASARPGVWIPVLNLVIDLFENLLITVLIKIFPLRVQVIETFAAYVIQLKWLTFKVSIAIMFISLFVGIYYGFHSLLADSVVLEKDRQKKLASREKVQEVLQNSAARRATSAATGRAQSVNKKDS
ncbi:hypothetical protein EDC94DRAFT_581358 [Helicostylum pulchrum]|uniref:Uncharacterized protein n=1 Tax=Helicostylum pulchrum TaxID=562976 RepID=A0ABP9XZG6_9FUNG|nr:hypothetical protein EDC94DRAFT_581358 [Helicostylum pulchrum]